MDASIIETELTDGSTVFDVVFVDGSTKVAIACESRHNAVLLQDALQTFAVYATVQ